jgi:DtxR family Mn-dependent transcriptional regulator
MFNFGPRSLFLYLNTYFDVPKSSENTVMLEAVISLIILLLIFGLGIWLFRPHNGFFWRWQRTRKMTRRILREDALKHLHRCERYGRKPSIESVAGALQISGDRATSLLSELQAAGFVSVEGDDFDLTPEGHSYALHVIRAHRLWERYLADETGYAREGWHEQAEQAEHYLSPEATEELAAELGYPTHDPHGDPIPTAAGDMVPHGGKPLTEANLHQPVRIVHLEDEPETVYAQLVAEGLNPGMEARLLEISSTRIRFWANGDEHILAPVVAASISIVPIPEPIPEAKPDYERLSDLHLGEHGEVMAISQSSRGTERRRFLDLGILPGTVITAEIASPGGDPTAYRIRDALIALRKEQAAMIRIRKLSADVG